jgi:DNA modification methylase
VLVDEGGLLVTWEVFCSETLAALRTVADCTVDAVVTDPPYGLEFMGKDWDCFRRARNPNDVGRDDVFGRASRTSPHSYGESQRGRFIEFMTEVFAECQRVLKPGGHLAAFGGTRTYHWLATAVEDAGFEIRDQLQWIYGQGFPKSLNVTKAMQKDDKVAPLEVRPASGFGFATNPQWNEVNNQLVMPEAEAGSEAARWEGWGTALKPACEPIVFARKALVGTVVENVRAFGTGAINIDECRVANATPGKQDRSDEPSALVHEDGNTSFRPKGGPRGGDAAGRWPANVVLSHAEDCVQVGTIDVKANGSIPAGKTYVAQNVVYGQRQDITDGYEAFGNGDGTETVEKWACVSGCPVRELENTVDSFSFSTYDCEACRELASIVESSFRPSLARSGRGSPSSAPGSAGGCLDGNEGARTPGDTSERRMADGIGSGVSQETATSSPSLRIGGPGSSTMDQFQMATRSTTRTTTQPTIPSATSNSSQLQTMTTTTKDSGKTTESLMESNNGTAKDVADISLLQSSPKDPRGLTTATARNARLITSESGGPRIGSITTHTCERTGQSTGRSRFFYCAKPARSEKDAGCPEAGITPKYRKGDVEKKDPYYCDHPTVKPVSLLQWIVRLVTPPGGLVLDPFCGSGSTGVACVSLGFDFAGIDQDEGYCAIARARIAHRAARISLDRDAIMSQGSASG